MGSYNSKNSKEIEAILNRHYPTQSIEIDAFDELKLELIKQRNITEIIYIPYNEFYHISYITNENNEFGTYSNYSAAWKANKTIQVILRELIDCSSVNMTLDKFKVVN
jgi:hypothetical protein